MARTNDGSTLFRRLTRWATGEHLLDEEPNGGDIVLLRALRVTFVAYALALLARECFDAKAIWWTFSFRELLDSIAQTLPWLAAIFAGTYAAFYARFASQWTYLAGVYNDMMSARVQTSKLDNEQSEALAMWQASFVEDAMLVHLARKSSYAALIDGFILDPAVQAQLVSEFGPERAALARLDRWLAARFKRSPIEELQAAEPKELDATGTTA